MAEKLYQSAAKIRTAVVELISFFRSTARTLHQNATRRSWPKPPNQTATGRYKPAPPLFP